MSGNPIQLPPFAGAADDLWNLLLELARRVDVPWTLVGGQMVMLHGLECGRQSPRVSTDIDTVVDVRAAPDGMRRMVETLTALGLEPAAPPGPDGIMHRYVQANTAVVVDLAVPMNSVDVLVPEGLGPATDITTSPGGHAFPAPGTTQALARTELVTVTYDGRQGRIPRPNLLGSIVVKAVAVVEDNRTPIRHHRDLTFLCSLAEDPFLLAEAMTPKDRKRLRLAARRLLDDSPLWRELPSHSDDARATWQVLTQRSTADQ